MLTTATHRVISLVTPLLLALGCGPLQAQAAPGVPVTRGQMLYDTHCIACHNAQVHWRDTKLAADWDGLKEQVRRWQIRAGLGWTEADIVEVARYLNNTFYRYPQTSDVVGQLAAPPAR
jgi:mono/diheme cytochrome c family protein